jgi:hypothetical protein
MRSPHSEAVDSLYRRIPLILPPLPVDAVDKGQHD